MHAIAVYRKEERNTVVADDRRCQGTRRGWQGEDRNAPSLAVVESRLGDRHYRRTVVPIGRIEIVAGKQYGILVHAQHGIIPDCTGTEVARAEMQVSVIVPGGVRG